MWSLRSANFEDDQRIWPRLGETFAFVPDFFLEPFRTRLLKPLFGKIRVTVPSVSVAQQTPTYNSMPPAACAKAKRISEMAGYVPPSIAVAQAAITVVL
jgi:hypothetical protein